MNLDSIRPLRPVFLIFAILGFCVINGPFLYIALADQATYDAGMSNGLAQVFMAEAFLLMFFFAFLIAKLGLKKPGWGFFICMSLLGSMAFSIPLQLYLWLGRRDGLKEN
ncbi:hypothetical protein [Cerasicoccus fimbriatus]|uniref:hypothetical protein n=1 Tax=Cerasicoccus fimbriatus TaxID=3014554 RepID=UPI0022B2ADCE|nr:hypothetical protein [Cerasicoccus sp. TK19100]